jgi:tRNA(fMet)-specific endonuclease VapC
VICLDTNAVINLFNDTHSPLLSRIEAFVEGGQTVAVSSIVLFELWYGAAHSLRRKANADRIMDFMADFMQVLDFDRDDAKEAGEIRAFLKGKGTPIGPYDVLIAAQARRRDALLVTANTREFARVPRLRTEDWRKSF